MNDGEPGRMTGQKAQGAGPLVAREFSWLELGEKIPPELRANCVAGIQQLATTVLKGGGDNYHVVTTVPRDKSFRLFVSKVVTYTSVKRRRFISTLSK
jgi:hypothetical protein